VHVRPLDKLPKMGESANQWDPRGGNGGCRDLSPSCARIYHHSMFSIIALNTFNSQRLLSYHQMRCCSLARSRRSRGRHSQREPRACPMSDSFVSAIDRNLAETLVSLACSFVFHSTGQAERGKAEGGAFI